MTSHERSSASSFTRAAGTYEDLAHVQSRVAIRLESLLPEKLQPVRILDAGCGTGLLTERLAARFPGAKIDAVDVSRGMIEAARDRRPSLSDRVTWHVADVRRFRGGSPYGLIAGSSSLHWALPLDDTFRLLAGQLESGGCLAAAIMLDGTLGELHAARRLAAPGKPPKRSLPSGDDLRNAVSGAGLRLESLVFDELVTWHDSAEALLSGLRRQGLTGGDFSRSHAPLARRELRELARVYAERYGGPGGGRVPATYRVGWCVARR